MIRTIVFLLCLGFSIHSASGQETEMQQDIVRLLELSGSDKIADQMFNHLVATFKKTNPEIPDKFWETFKEEIDAAGYYHLVIPIYEKYYTHEEIRQLIDFYNTPIGQKTIRVTPMVMQESIAAGQKWGAELGKKVHKRLMEESNIKIKED